MTMSSDVFVFKEKRQIETSIAKICLNKNLDNGVYMNTIGRCFSNKKPFQKCVFNA